MRARIGADVLADPGGEDEGVEAAEGGGEHPGVQRAAVDEVVDREGGARVVAGQKVAHVVGDAGQALEAGSLVEKVATTSRALMPFWSIR